MHPKTLAPAKARVNELEALNPDYNSAGGGGKKGPCRISQK